MPKPGERGDFIKRTVKNVTAQKPKAMPISTTASRSKGFTKDGPEQKKFNAAQLGRAGKK